MTAQSRRIGLALRDRGMVGCRLLLRLDYIDGSTVVRQRSLRRGVADDFTLQAVSLLLLKRAWTRRARIRSCRLSCQRLHRKSPQLSLFPDRPVSDRKKDHLHFALDRVREKFGADSVRFGSQTPLH